MAIAPLSHSMTSLRRMYNKSRRNAAAVAGGSVILLVLFITGAGAWEQRGYIFLFGPAAGAVAREEQRSCQDELQALEGRAARCRYLQSSHPPCAPQGYIDYLTLFYCACGDGQEDELWWSPWLGGVTIGLWLLLLFYLLGDTASEYFCASLEGLSAALRLPPAVAGVTLLSLGNGAPDVLSSVVAFASGGAGDVGLSGALGGSLFVSTVVAGLVSIVAARRHGGAEVVIERRGFVRDVSFLLVALGYLLAVLLAGTVTVWAAAAFLSLYAAYVLVVSASHCCPCAADRSSGAAISNSNDLAAPLLPVADSKVQKKPPPGILLPPPPRRAALPPAPPHHPGHRRAPLVTCQRGRLRSPRPSPPRSRHLPAHPNLPPRRRPHRRAPRGRGGLDNRRRNTPTRPVRVPDLARRRVPHVHPLVVRPRPRARVPARVHRHHRRHPRKRPRRHRPRVGQLAGRPGLGCGDGDPRRRGGRADCRSGLLRGAGVQHGGGAGALDGDRGGGEVPGAVRGAGGGVDVRDGGVPGCRAGVGAGGAPGAGHAAGRRAGGWPARALPLLPRRQARRRRRRAHLRFVLPWEEYRDVTRMHGMADRSL